jgi:hypothetical protein
MPTPARLPAPHDISTLSAPSAPTTFAFGV